MAIDFPNSPATGDTFTADNRTWEWSGSAWEILKDAIYPIQKTIVDAKGDLIVATADDIPARLAVGTNGYVLTADSAETTGVKWASSSAGALTKISSATVTASSSVSFDNAFTSTYTNYIIKYRFEKTTTGAQSLILRLRASNTDNSTSNYQNQTLIGAGTSAVATRSTETGFILNTAEEEWLVGTVDVFQPELAERTLITMLSVDHSGGYTFPRTRNVFGNFNTDAQFDGFTFYIGSGDLNGTVEVYGLEN